MQPTSSRTQDNAFAVEVVAAFASRDGAGPQTRHLFSRLEREIARQVRKSTLHSGKQTDLEDVSQFVLMKFSQQPPRLDRPDFEYPTLLQWIKVTVRNHLISQHRARTGKRVEPATEFTPVKPREQDECTAFAEEERFTSPDATLGRQQEVEKALVYLEETYPLGARLIHAALEMDGATPAELANSLGVSVANLYQIQKRTQARLAEWLEHTENVRTGVAGRLGGQP